MNKFFKLLILFCTLFTIVITGCKKDSSNPADKLPPATTEGKNTFACLINGQPFIVNFSGNNQAITAQYFTTSYSNKIYYEFFIDGTSVFNNENGTIDIRATLSNNFIDGQTIELSNGSNLSQGNFTFNSTLFTSSNAKPAEGEIHLTKVDTVNNILSGTFWFNAYSDLNKSKKYSITDGRFDVKYSK